MTNTTAELCEPDNPAAWALAQHIADHPVSTIQAAFRYLNTPLTLELREAPAVVEPPADQTAADVRDQLLHAIDFNYVASLGYTSPEELLAAYDTSRTQPADRAALHRIAEAALAAVETALGDTLAADAREEALAGIAAVLPEPTDRAAVPSAAVRKKLRRWAYAAGHIESELDDAVDRMYELVARDVLRRMADETATTQTTRDCPPDCPCRAVCIGTRQDDTVHSCPGRWGGPDCRCFDAEPAAAARQDGATQ